VACLKTSLVLGILLVLSVIDIKKRSITVVGPVILVVVGLIFNVISGLDYKDMLLPCMVGVFMIIVSKISRESIGFGDSLLILSLGVALDFETFIQTLLVGMMWVCLYSLMLIIVFKKGKKYRVPFIPFLAAGYIIVLGVGLI